MAMESAMESWRDISYGGRDRVWLDLGSALVYSYRFLQLTLAKPTNGIKQSTSGAVGFG